MQLTLARHPVTDLRFDTPARLEGSILLIDRAELRRLVLEDESIVSVDFDIARPGERCRAGPIFDVIEPRAKAPGCGADFPGILGAPITAGIGTTHVLTGAAVSVLAEISPDPTRSATGRVLEMSGAPVEASEYSSLQHLIVIPHTKPGLPRQTLEKLLKTSCRMPAYPPEISSRGRFIRCFRASPFGAMSRSSLEIQAAEDAARRSVALSGRARARARASAKLRRAHAA